MDKISLRQTGNNGYFTTSIILNEASEKVGIIEYHYNCKKSYYVGWKLDKPKNPNMETGTTKGFDTLEAAISFSLEGGNNNGQ